jgi:hypothetical protein
MGVYGIRREGGRCEGGEDCLAGNVRPAEQAERDLDLP